MSASSQSQLDDHSPDPNQRDCPMDGCDVTIHQNNLSKHILDGGEVPDCESPDNGAPNH